MITEEIIEEKIAEIIQNTASGAAVETIVLIMKELAVAPRSVDPIVTIDRTIDMICKERFR